MSSTVLGVIAAMAEISQQDPQDRRKGPPKPVVALSRDYGCGGDVIAERLAQKLEVPLFDKELVAEVALRLREHPSIVQLMDEDAAATRDMWLFRFFAGGSLTPQLYRDTLLMVIANVARLGGVIVGHGAHVALADACALRVRITGTPEICAQRMASQGHGEAAQLRHRAGDVNKKRALFVWNLFQSRVSDASRFDIIVNTDRMIDFEDVVDTLFQMATAIHQGRMLGPPAIIK